jgi:hypothetical protein
MVGAAGLEPAFSRPQTERDTRLRHAPKSRSSLLPLSTRPVHPRLERDRNRVSQMRTVSTPCRERHVRPASCLLLDLRCGRIEVGSTASSPAQNSRSWSRSWSAWYWIRKAGGFSEQRRIHRAAREQGWPPHPPPRPLLPSAPRWPTSSPCAPSITTPP